MHYSEDSDNHKYFEQDFEKEEVNYERAKKNALKFLEILKKRTERKVRIRGMVKKFVDIVKRIYLEKKQKKQAFIKAA